MPSKNKPGGGCCCETCIVLDDDFDRPDNSDPGTAWSEEAGTSAIASDKLALTASNSRLFTTAATTGDNQVVSAAIVGANIGDVAGIILRGTDANNYLTADVTFTHAAFSTLTIRRRNGGTTTTLLTTAPSSVTAGDTVILKACLQGTRFTAELFKTGTRRALLAAFITSMPTGKKAGVYTGSITSLVTFDDFVFQRHNEYGETDCDQCAVLCAQCDSAYLPYSAYIVDLGAPALTDDACGFCDQIGGEYLVIAANSLTPCTWTYVEFACTAAIAYNNLCANKGWNFSVQLFATFVSAGVMKWSVTIRLTNNVSTDPTCGNSREARYESSNISTATRCQDMPVTLTKVFDNMSTVPSGQALCSGSMPGTITLKAPA